MEKSLDQDRGQQDQLRLQIETSSASSRRCAAS